MLLGCAVRDVASPEEGTACAPTPRTGLRAAPGTPAPFPRARKGPLAGNARAATVHLLSLFLPDSISDLCQASLISCLRHFHLLLQTIELVKMVISAFAQLVGWSFLS